MTRIHVSSIAYVQTAEEKIAFSVFCLLSLLFIFTQPVVAQDTYSVPIRWCVIGNDANGNGAADPGENGAPAFTDPENVGETATDFVLWRRHERPSDATYIPQADITLRSALWNIAEDETLSFPIIPDPCDPENPPDDPDACPGGAPGEYGDILDHQIDSWEWETAYNACIDAWTEDHEVEDIGIVAINVRKIVDSDGDEAFFAWSFGKTERRTYLEDNAWSYCNSDTKTSSVCDGVDKTFGHEIGHAFGLAHTCEDDNLMRQGRQDTDGDDVLDNFQLSDSIEQVTDKGDDDKTCTADDSTEIVNQIDESREAAQEVPGCKSNGTNTDCSVQSHIRTDKLTDADQPYLDITRVRVTDKVSANTTEFSHELRGPLDEAAFVEFSELEYFVFADLDNDSSTGGMPADLGIPTDFEGAELVTRVRPNLNIVGALDSNSFWAHLFDIIPAANAAPLPLLPIGAVGTVWRFQAGAFQEINDPSIKAQVHHVVGSTDAPTDQESEHHLTDWVMIEFSNAIRGPKSLPVRVQAITVGQPANDGSVVVDRLEDSDRGKEFKLRFPTFPVCSVTPNPAFAGGAATVQASGLLPNREIHVVLGEDTIATGTTDATGGANVNVVIPDDTTLESHLVTVGVDGTGLTADCVVDVPERQITSYEYAAKLICGVQKDTRNMQLARGFYGTSINIHNPNDEPVSFLKRLAMTIPPGYQRPGKVIPIATDTLSPREGLAVDCDDVKKRVFHGQMPTPFIEAFITIESPASLDVTGVYTTATLNAEGTAEDHSSLHVEQIRERISKKGAPNPNQPDLIVKDIDLNSLRVDCSSGTGSCVTRVPVTIENIGAGDANVFNSKTNLDPQQSVQVDHLSPLGLKAGSSETFNITSPRGGNCFDPDCTVCVVVDSNSDVSESNESNNKMCKVKPG